MRETRFQSPVNTGTIGGNMHTTYNNSGAVKSPSVGGKTTNIHVTGSGNNTTGEGNIGQIQIFDAVRGSQIFPVVCIGAVTSLAPAIFARVQGKIQVEEGSSYSSQLKALIKYSWEHPKESIISSVACTALTLLFISRG